MMKLKYTGTSEDVCLIKNKLYNCLGEECGQYKVIDEEGYDEDEEIQGYLYPQKVV